MTTISAEKARNSFSELLSHTAYSKDRVVVTRNGKKMAAIVSIEDLELLERLEDVEDTRELERMRKGNLSFTKIEDFLNEMKRGV